jgi:TonB-dependent starch-binding outer membrane protein SusC
MKKIYSPLQRPMQTYLCLCLLFFTFFGTNAIASGKKLKVAAEFTVIGVVSEENGNQLPGVAIQLKGTNKGAVTDSKGRYSINAEKKDAVLVFSMLGFTAQTIPVNGKSVINVTLKPDVKTLEEVVFIGYGTAQKKDVTGAITTLKMEDVKGMNFAGIDQAMQGKVAGVNVTNNTGQPGGGVSVRIRGLTSLTGSNEPLYVIDGVPFNGDGDNTVDASQFGGGGGQTNSSVLASLNPNDILTLDILKDASATAIYGSRASNGVIIITTKRGKMNESKITYDGSIGTQMTPKKLDVMNLAEYAAYTNNINTSIGRKPNEEFAKPEILGTGTNWQNEIFRLAKVTNHQLSFSGGKDGSTFYVSGGYFKQEGIVVGSEFERLSLRVNLDNQVKSWLKIGSSLTASKTSQRITLNDDEGGVIANAFLQNPSIAVKNPNGSWGGPTESNGGNQVNPVALALLIDNNKYNTRFNGNLFADVTFLKYFSFRNEFGGDLGFGNNVAFKPTFNWGQIYNFQNKLITQNSQSINLYKRYW